MVLSISIVLFFLGSFLLTVFHFEKSTKLAQEKVNHVIELDENAEYDHNQVLKSLQLQNFIKKSTVRYIPKSEAKAFMLNELDTSIISSEENPFSDVILFNLNSDASLDLVRSSLSKIEGVKQAHIQSLEMDALKNNIQKFGSVLLALALVFGLMSIALIFSTLQLQLYADRFEIKTMELVGAQDRFIKMPYFRRAFRLANLSVLISGLLLTLMMLFLKYKYDFFDQLLGYSKLAAVLILLWVFAVLFLFLVSNYLINKYLSKKMQDLYR